MTDSTWSLVCRHCERPVAVPASRCPWCEERIMIVCANCLQYADDSRPNCEHCGEPLQEHSREKLTRLLGVEPGVAELAADQERAQLIASGVVGQGLPFFFFDDGARRTVIASLFGTPRTLHRSAEALLFASVAYLIEKGYCTLVPGEAGAMNWEGLRVWNGQVHSLEGELAVLAGYDLSLEQALDRVVRKVMDFRYERIPSPLVRTPGMPETPPVANLSSRTAIKSVIDLSQQTVLPSHDADAASAEIHRVLVAFVRSSPERTRYVVGVIRDTLNWFVEFEQDPSIALLRDMRDLPAGAR